MKYNIYKTILGYNLNLGRGGITAISICRYKNFSSGISISNKEILGGEGLIRLITII